MEAKNDLNNVVVFFADFSIIINSTIILRRGRCVSWPWRGTRKTDSFSTGGSTSRLSSRRGTILVKDSQSSSILFKFFLLFPNEFIIRISMPTRPPRGSSTGMKVRHGASSIWGSSSKVVKWRIKTCHIYALIRFCFWKEKIKEICPTLIFGHAAVVVKSVGLLLFSFLLG